MKNIGSLTVESLCNFVREPRNRMVVENLIAILEIGTLESNQDSGPSTSTETHLDGHAIHFSGALESMTRDRAMAAAKNLGARTPTSISSKSTILVTRLRSFLVLDSMISQVRLY